MRRHASRIKLTAAGCLALALLIPARGRAADGKFTAGGYFKSYLYSLAPARVRGFPAGQPGGAYAVTEDKLRLKTAWDGGSGVRAEAAYELIYTGRKSGLAAARPLGSGPGASWRVADLGRFLSPSSGGGSATSALAQDLDRAFITWSPSSFDLYAGRQPLAFGSARAVNPTDVLAPYPFGTLDTEERPGVDALRVKLPWKEMGELDAGWLPGRDWAARAGAGFLRAKRDLAGLDLTLISAAFRGSLMAGANVERPAGGALLRLEAAQVWAGSFSARRPGEDFFRLSAGGEYNFNVLGGTDAWLEYHYNGAGAGSAGGYASRKTLTAYKDAGVYLAGRHYLSAGASAQLSALVAAAASVMINLGDRSFYAVPSLEWNAAQNLYLSAGALLPSGPAAVFKGGAAVPVSEFGLYDKALYASLRKYF